MYIRTHGAINFSIAHKNNANTKRTRFFFQNCSKIISLLRILIFVHLSKSDLLFTYRSAETQKLRERVNIYIFSEFTESVLLIVAKTGRQSTRWRYIDHRIYQISHILRALIYLNCKHKHERKSTQRVRLSHGSTVLRSLRRPERRCSWSNFVRGMFAG